jgi:hypothetical protein
LDVCQFLVEKGANVAPFDADAPLPVARPAAYSSKYDEVDSDEAPSLSSDDDSGIPCRNTPLHWSSEGGFLDVCQFLVEKGANVNTKDDKYDTQPFTYA